MSNSLAEAKYKLGLQAQKLYLYVVSQIDEDSKDFNNIKVKLLDFSNASNGDIKQLYKDIDKITDELMSTFFKLKQAGDKWMKYNLLSMCSYDNGELTIKFDKDMKPYLLDLKGSYLRHQLDTPIQFKNKYSIRIYQLLKANQYRFEKHKINHIVYDLKEFREIVGVGKGQYPNFYDLRKRVLEVAKDEINNKSDITYEYDKITENRKAVGLTFKIMQKDSEEKLYIEYINKVVNIPELKDKMGLTNEKFNSKQTVEIYEKAIKKTQDNFDPFEYVRLNYLYIKEKGSARNIYSYLMGALEEDYAAAAGQLTLLNMV